MSLQGFALSDLAQYTKEKAFPVGASDDHRLFYVGRDDVHGILTHLFDQVADSVYMNMFGYDDDALNKTIMGLVNDPTVRVQVTLDKSQSGGVHEKQILTSDAAADPAGYKASFAIGQSSTHQISHTKGGVLDGTVGFEGSTNWSASGEGTIPLSGPRVAQNNTLMVFTDPVTVRAFTDELNQEHQVVLAQGGALVASPPPAAHSPS